MENKNLTANDAREYFPAAADFVAHCIEIQNDPAALVAFRDANKEALLQIKEFVARSKYAAAQGEDFLKKICSVGEDTLPTGIKWSKQSYTSSFADPQAACFKLIELENTPMENFLRGVTVKQACEAAGITEDRLRAYLGDMIVDKPKARTLYIK